MWSRTLKVKITYYDTDSLTVEEVLATAKQNYGEFVEVEVFPESNDPRDIIYFGLQQLITFEQLSLLFDNTPLYDTKLKDTKDKILSQLAETLDQVVKDNEVRVR